VKMGLKMKMNGSRVLFVGCLCLMGKNEMKRMIRIWGLSNYDEVVCKLTYFF